jgi:hypothetical protein
MQVATERRISDEESVKLGAAKLANAYQKALSAGVEKATEKKVVFDPGKNHYHRLFVVSRVAAAYNKDDGYVSEVRELQQAIAREFYPELSPPPPPRFSDQYIHFI